MLDLSSRLDLRSEAGFEGQLDELVGGEGAGTNDLTRSTLREVGGLHIGELSKCNSL